jgi:signal transduction histidine kinase
MKAAKERDASYIGWGSGFRLALYYVGFFTVVCALVFGVIYRGIGDAIDQRELDIVRNRASEYRAWFVSGQLEMMTARMDEQSMETGDIMFVHVAGQGLNHIKFNAPDDVHLPVEELKNFPVSREGANVLIDGEPWTVASVPIGSNGLVLQAGKNAHAREKVLRQLQKLYFLTLIPAALVALLGGALLTYRAMAPIRRLTVTMREILHAGDQGQRVERIRTSGELNPLVALFNRLLERNETLIGAMNNSLDSVAHDMRTPLSRLMNTAEVALRDEASDPAALREALADCVEETEQMGRLLTTLMDVAEAEAGAMRLQREELSLPDLIESVAELYQYVAEEKSIRIETELPDVLIVNADRTRLSQVLANLVDNAVKYSPKDSCIVIGACVDGDQTVITVRDEGIGISEADMPMIWDRLFRAERSRTTPGMGLGLSFVKAIVEAHGGHVECESRVEQGATFRVRLPR